MKRKLVLWTKAQVQKRLEMDGIDWSDFVKEYGDHKTYLVLDIVDFIRKYKEK